MSKTPSRAERSEYARLFARLTDPTANPGTEVSVASFTRPTLVPDARTEFWRIMREIEHRNPQPPREAISFLEDCLRDLEDAGKQVVALGTIGLMLSIGEIRNAGPGRAIKVEVAAIPTFRILVAGPGLNMVRSTFDREGCLEFVIKETNNAKAGLNEVLLNEREARVKFFNAVSPVSKLELEIMILQGWFHCKTSGKYFVYSKDLGLSMAPSAIPIIDEAMKVI